MPSSTKPNQGSKSAKLSGPQIHLATGGGTLKGMGESFSANPFSGSATLNIPIFCSPCRHFEPALSINYNSSSGNDIFGLGFSTSLSSISRRTEQKIPQYNEADIFVLNGGEILVPIDNSACQKTIDKRLYIVTRYRPRFEADFERIELWRSQNDITDIFWCVGNRDNINFIYGQGDQAKIVDPANNTHIYSWLLEAVYDAKGNAQYYNYKQENSENVPNVVYEKNRTQNANKYPEKILYGNFTPFIPTDAVGIKNIASLAWHFEVVFDYGEYNVSPKNDHIHTPTKIWPARADAFSHYKTGFERRTHRLCRNILMFHLFEEEFGKEPVLTHSTNFTYDENSIGSRLIAAQTIGWRYYGDRISGSRYLIESLPPLTLDYINFNPNGHQFIKLTDKEGNPLPSFSGRGSSNFIDLYAEGVPGILNQEGNSFGFFSPEKGQGGVHAVTYNPLTNPATLPLGHGPNNPYFGFGDVDGNGFLELLNTKPLESGYYAAQQDRSWGNFTSFAAFPTDFHFSNNQFVDISGSGQADILSLQDDFTQYSISDGYQGYLPAQMKARFHGLPTAFIPSREEVVLFADILGSGQRHQVHITNGKIVCWPNLGYGQLGEKIELGNVPHLDDFDVNRIHLADIDGSGALDFIYAYPDRIEIYTNQGGNSFAIIPIVIPLPINYYSPAQISFIDVYGSGNSCLVFTDDNPSSNQWVYDFCEARKPYLLSNITNNIGAKTTIAYTSATQFYLKDKQAGKPWVTALPHPIQVVAQLIYEDDISQNRLVNTFSYHHGYYDFIECEFRGFGRIERLDLETATQSSNAHKNNNFLFDDGQYVAPSLTKIWYHTGAWNLPKPLVDYFAQEYFQSDINAYPMPSPVFNGMQNSSDPVNQIQAFVALQSRVLRTEIYGFNGTKIEEVPYAASQTNYEVKLLQAKGNFSYAIFHTSERESISYHYELNASDPNISHGFTLEIDDYGNIVRSCNVYYPRRPDITGSLPDQKILRVDCTTSAYVEPLDEDDVYLFGLKQETKEYEMTQLTPGTVLGLYFDFDDIASQINQALIPSFLSQPIATLLTWDRFYYLQDNLGQITPQALPISSEQAVFSDPFFKDLFSGKQFPGGLENFLITQGGYYLDKTNEYWWSPVMTIKYSDINSFYTIASAADPFYGKTLGRSGSISLYSYDLYNLLIKTVTTQSRDHDVLPSTATALKIDYRTLQPIQLQDPNGTIAEILQSPLGFVLASSHYGSEYQQGSIKPVGFTALPLENDFQWPQPESLDDLINHADKFLAGASNFFYYDFYCWSKDKKPICSVELSAQEYPKAHSPNTPIGDIQIGIQFSDGFGRTLQNKQRVEPGDAFLFDNQGNPIIGLDGKIKQGLADPRWLTSGRVRYNNKGKPFQQYEPYFTSTYYFVDNKALNTFGISDTLFYDPLSRPISVVQPKGTFKNAFFSKIEHTAWTQVSYDGNDTIKDSPYYQYYITAEKGDLPLYEKDALLKAAHFYNTPTTHILDNLGNTIQTIDMLEGGNNESTYSSYDILDRKIWSADSRLHASGIKNFQWVYDMSGAMLHSVSVDAGAWYALYDVFGQSIYYGDAREVAITHAYDSFRRLVQVYVQGGEDLFSQTTERMIYGDSLDAQGKTIYSDLTGRNVRGKVCVVYDQALRKEVPYFTIQGSPLTVSQQIRATYKNEANWNVTLPNNWSWQNLFDLLKKDIDDNSFLNTHQYDALGRISSSLDSDENSTEYQYYVSGMLAQAQGSSKEGTPYACVTGIAYNAHRDRQQITYANSSSQPLLNIQYTYDPDNFNLVNIFAERLSDKTTLQNLTYHHDPADNVTHVENQVLNLPIGSINADALEVVTDTVTPDLDYTYDAMYRLLQAQGRAIAGFSPKNEEEGSYQAFFPTAQTENYLYKYTYDEGNNLYGVQYITQNTLRWSRSLTVSSRSNRAVELPPQFSNKLTLNEDPTEKYFDANGNQILLGESTKVTWNYRDNVASIDLSQTDVENLNNTTSKIQYFTYNQAGQRVRAVTETKTSAGNTQIDEFIYFGKLIIRRTSQDQIVKEEFHKVRFFDDNTCVAEKLTWVVGNPPSGIISPQVRFQLGNLLDSSVMEIDSQSQLISYEEYAPFGSTTYAWSKNQPEIDLKQFRYHSKERDQQNGLYYFGARYYSPWLRRWLSPDPAGAVDGLNLYAYVSNNPVAFSDYSGLGGDKRQKPVKKTGRGWEAETKKRKASQPPKKAPPPKKPRLTRQGAHDQGIKVKDCSHVLDEHRDEKNKTKYAKSIATKQKKVNLSKIPAIETNRDGNTTLKYKQKQSDSSSTPVIAMPFGQLAKKYLNSQFQHGPQGFSDLLAVVYTGKAPQGLPEKYFTVQRGRDIVINRTVTNEDGSISSANINQTFASLANKLDKVAQSIKDAYGSAEGARRRISRDVQRVGGGKNIKGEEYTPDEWSDVTEFAMVVRADKTRAPGATKYIDDVLTNKKKSFTQRYGTNADYLGTGQGRVSIGEKNVAKGPAALREIAKGKDSGFTVGYDTDYGSSQSSQSSQESK